MDYLTIWIMAGLAMLILEVMLPAFGFLGGALAAFIIAIIRSIDPTLLTLTGEIITFSIISVVLIFILQKMLYKKSSEDYQDTILGSRVKIIELPKEEGAELYYRVTWSGSIFNAQTLTDTDVSVGDVFIVESVTGTLLTIKKEK